MQSNIGDRPSSSSIFGEDGKLSSASAATSLKYARAQDLPSYPSTGGVQLSSAGAAASLAASNRKTFEHWKPEPIPAANRAALLAKDHKMDPLWQPEASAAGSRAAMKAHANPIEVEPMQPKKPADNKSATPSAAYDTRENSHRKALMAATAVHNRRRSGSMPTTVTSPTDSAAWAMKAANKSHKDGASSTAGAFTTGDPGFEAARIQNVAKNNVDRQLYTSSPPVAIEVQEKNRQDTLRASAIAMAQKMYAIQQKQIDEAKAGAEGQGQALAASRARSSTVGTSSPRASGDYTYTGAGYENLEEAARKLAQARLAKIHDEHAEYRNYYGTQTSPPNRPRRLGRRDSAADDDSDEEQSRKIRSQMSIFKSNLADVDNKKRQQDRDALLEIAHRNVDAQMAKMDNKVFQDTGKASPAQAEKWEKAAREKAQADSDARMVNTGKVHIGGGKYIDQSELDAIAKARLQPTLDDISDKAEKQRARDEQERLERERQQQKAARDKAREAETAAAVKAETARVKQEERTRKEEEKRAQKEAEVIDKERRKAAAAEEKERARLEKEEKRKSRDTKPGRISALLGRGDAPVATEADKTSVTAAPAAPEALSTSPEVSRSSEEPSQAGVTVHDQVTRPTAESVTPVVTNLEPASSTPSNTLLETKPRHSLEERKSLDKRLSTDDDADPTSPTSGSKSRVKSWMKGRFGKKGDQKDNDTMPAVAETQPTENQKEKEKEKAPEDDAHMPRTDSMRDVAMAGRSTTGETDDMYGRDVSPVRESAAPQTRDRSSSISSISSEYSKEAPAIEPKSFSLGTTKPEPTGEERGRSGIRNKLLKKIRPNKDKNREKEDVGKVAPVASNTTDDEFEEAKDQFEEEKLAPPPPLSTLAGESSVKRPASPRGSREGSRFKEEL